VSTLIESRDPNREQRQQQQQEQQAAVARSRLVQKLLAPTPDLKQFLYDLAYTQAVVVAGTEAAAFMLIVDEQNQGTLDEVAHIRPDGSPQDVRLAAMKAFREIAASCIREGKDGAVEVAPADNNFERQYCLVTLLRTEGRIVAATAVITRCRDDARAQQRLDVMQVVAGYFDFQMLRRSVDTMKIMTQTQQDVLQYAAAVGTSSGYQNAVNNLCNEIASRAGAVRVSMGWVQGLSAPKIKLKGLSHTEQFDKKQELSVQIIKVMEECFDQDEVVQFAPGVEAANTANITRESAALSRMEGNNRILSVPLRRKVSVVNSSEYESNIVGVLTMEFPPNKVPTEYEITNLVAAAEMLGPYLFDRFQNDRWLPVKAGISARETWKLGVGPRYWLAKLLIIAGLAFVGFIVFYSPMHRVKAPFEFGVVEKRIITAGVEGIIQEVKVRPGDLVKTGDVLVKFKDDEVAARRFASLAKAAMSEQQARIYENDPEKKSESIALAQLERKKREEALAEVKLADIQLEKLTVRATINGRIDQGDLRDKIGSSVKQGEQLMLISDPDTMRVEISLNERDVQRVRDPSMGEQTIGSIKTASRPDIKHKVKVDRIVPSGQAKEGTNVFTVYASIDKSDPNTNDEILSQWRPGMKGEVALDDKPRPLIYQWTHRLVDWLRLELWL